MKSSSQGQAPLSFSSLLNKRERKKKKKIFFQDAHQVVRF
jgi:hypothetical protein